MNHTLRRKNSRKLASVAGRDPLKTFTVGAMFLSSAFSGLASAAAAETSDPRLRTIDDAINGSVARARGLIQYAADSATPVAQAPMFDFQIPPALLQEVVAALERQASVRIAFAKESLGTLNSPGVTGRMTLEQALHAILAGTGVDFRSVTGTSFVLDLETLSESVSVTAAVATIASPKYNAPLRDIPQTIEVIPRAAMDAQGVTTLSEALRNVPGITLQAGEGGGASSTAGDMFNMRGFNASNSLFVDNVRDDGVISRDVFNLEQVEVFMGPTGSDVGRGTASGYVNMQSKTPHLPPATSATLSLGTAAQRRATIDLNQPLSRTHATWLTKSAVRLNVLWQDSGIAGRDVARNETKAISPSIAFGLSTGTRVIGSAQILRQDNDPDYGVPAAAWSKAPLTATTVRALGDVPQSNYYGSPDVDYDRANQNTFTFRVEHDLASRWSITNQTRRNRTDREAIVTSPGGFTAATQTVSLSRQGNIRENEITSNQTAVVGRVATGRLDHSLSSGIEITSESQYAPTLTGVGTRAPVDIYRPNPSDPVTGLAPVLSGAFTDGRTSTVAGYAFDTVSVGPRVRANGGVRIEHYKTEFKSVNAAGVTTADLDGSSHLVSGKVGLTLRIAGATNAYGSYGTTLTPPGAANFSLSASSNNQNNPEVKPQKSSNVEVGVKSDLAAGRLSLSAAVFHTINENVLFTVDAAAVPPVYNQDDKQRVDGVSLGASGQITPGWTVLANFSYLDSESLTQNSTNNGKRLSLTPEFSGSLWTTYRLPKGWTFGGGVRASGQAFVNSANTLVLPGSTVVDALAEYTVTPKLTLRLNLYNALDEVYIRSVNNNGARYNPGYARTVQVTTAVKF